MSKFNENKFKEVLHYIIDECGSIEHVGKTILYKVLYYADFDYYEEFEKYLTGEDYYKLPHGPAPSHFDTLVKELKSEDMIREVRIPYHGHTLNKFISVREAKLSSLKTQEKKVVDNAISKICPMTAKQASEYSHLEIGRAHV